MSRENKKGKSEVVDKKGNINTNHDMLLVSLYFFLFVFLAWKAPYIIGALVLGFYFSIILSVPYDFVMKKTKIKYLAIGAYVLVVVIFNYAIISFFPTVIGQVNAVIQRAQGAQLTLDLPSWAVKYIDELKVNVSAFLGEVVKYIANALPSLVTMVMLLIVTMLGIESIKVYFNNKVQLLFVDNPEYGERFIRQFFSDVRRYIRGQVLVSLISATLTTIGLYFIGVPSALTLGVLSFIGGFFPFIGLLITAVPMYLLAFTSQGVKGMLWLTVLLVAVNQTESWLYGPRIQGNNLKLHWSVIMLSIFIFGSILGFAGVLLALPILLFVRNFWRFYILKLRR
ncbi:AI-2E family transporter [Fervidobacterium sp.]